MDVLGVLRGMFGPPDPRSDDQIDSDIDDEFAFHLAQSQREFIEKGALADEAKQSALARFGDVQRFKRECRRVAREEKTMLQRINLILMVLVFLAVIGVSVQVYMTQRYNTLAIQGIVSQLNDMQIERDAAARAQDQPRVLVQGDVENPGWYPITYDPPTLLHEIITQAGVHPDALVHASNYGDISAHRLLGEQPEKKIVVRPGEEIHVRNPSPSPGDNGASVPEHVSARDVRPGLWREITEDGQPVENGATLRLLASDDIKNLQVLPAGTLNLPALEEPLTIMLTGASPSDETNLRLIPSLSATRHEGSKTIGKWMHQQDQLILWMPREPVQREEMLRLIHVDH